MDILNHQTEEKIKADLAKPPTYNPIRPSAAGSCTRELAFKCMEFTGKAKYEKEPYTPETHRIFSLGHSVEWNIIKQFEELTGEFFKVQYKQQSLSFIKYPSITDETIDAWLEGSMDLAFFSDKWKCVADIKSKKDKYSAYFKTNWDETTAKLNEMSSVETLSESAFWVSDLKAFLAELNDPFFAANFLQLNLYANSKFLQDRGVDHACIIQYNKNDSRLREVRFKPCPELYQAVLDKFLTAVDAARLGAPEKAPKDYMLGSIKCAFCDYKNQCWDENALKAYFETFPAKHWPKDTSKLGATGKKLEKAYVRYKQGAAEVVEAEQAEAEIIKLLLDQGVTKVRFEDEYIYEVKQYKSPRPHFKLKRSKI